MSGIKKKAIAKEKEDRAKELHVILKESTKRNKLVEEIKKRINKKKINIRRSFESGH